MSNNNSSVKHHTEAFAEVDVYEDGRVQVTVYLDDLLEMATDKDQAVSVNEALERLNDHQGAPATITLGLF